MVARNFPIQDISYSKLLQNDVSGEFLIGLKPTGYQNMPPQHSYQPTYYEFPNMNESQHGCPSIEVSTSLQQYQSLDSSSNSNMIDLDHQSSFQIDVEQKKCSYRKRKTPYQPSNDLEEEITEDNKSVKTNDENKKQNHSEIEKRRRDKMNTYILELSSMVPMCHAISRKLDKLTVLRMAVQHLKSIRASVNSYTGHYKPSFLSDHELKNLILQAADGFLFVVGCDRGRLLFVSDSVAKYLNYVQGDLLGQSLFDILHPKDVAKVKEQLSSSDLNPRERLIDAKTMLPVRTDVPQCASRLCAGARRSFFCRMKCKASGQVKEEADTTTGCQKKQSADKKFSVIHCTGYLKAWTPAKVELEDETVPEPDSCNLSCLVAVGRILPHISTIAVAQSQSNPNVKPIQFISRHALDGKFLFVDQRATLVLGYLPQELLGTSMYEYYHHDDIHFIAGCHKEALQNTVRVTTKIYRFKTKDGSYIKLQSEWKSFKNPWTKEIENLISKNNLIWTDYRMVDSSACKTEDVQQDFAFIGSRKEMQRIINNQVEASKIGRHIAEQVVESQRKHSPSPDSNENEASMHNPSNTETYISTSIPTTQSITQIQENDHLNQGIVQSIVAEPVSTNSGLDDVGIREMMEDAVRVEGPSNDGNDEAAMAVLMSMLEADANLGGPVDFSDLPWPLP